MTINGLMYVEAGISVSTIESMNPMMPERRNPSETPMNPPTRPIKADSAIKSSSISLQDLEEVEDRKHRKKIRF
ncbi:hypothetical protein HRED_10352 [Candidatus Haloredivivus sp. G17]|nr:hypothetical protein HRED_10352 [Candidatus Haloredivivus sp. G17]